MTEVTTATIHHDIEQIPNQIGNAIIHVSDGSHLKPPNGSLSTSEVDALYKILLESEHILNDNKESLKRMNIKGSNGISYVLAASKNQICIVKKSLR